MLRLIEDRIDHFGARVLALGPVMHVVGEEFKPPFKFDSPIGDIHATTTCRVTIRGKGLSVAITAKEARDLAQSLNVAASYVERHQQYVRGETTHRVTIRDGIAKLTIHQIEFTFRQQATRKPKREGYRPDCSRCRKKFSDGEKHWSSYRVDDRGWGPKPRLGEQRLCLSCFDACIVDETPRIEAVK